MSLRNVITEAGISLAELAREAGIPYETVVAYSNGYRRMPEDRGATIAQALMRCKNKKKETLASAENSNETPRALRVRLNLLGYSMKSFADDMGIPYPRMASYFNGYSKMPEKTYVAIKGEIERREKGMAAAQVEILAAAPEAIEAAPEAEKEKGDKDKGENIFFEL